MMPIMNQRLVMRAKVAILAAMVRLSGTLVASGASPEEIQRAIAAWTTDVDRALARLEMDVLAAGARANAEVLRGVACEAERHAALREAQAQTGDEVKQAPEHPAPEHPVFRLLKGGTTESGPCSPAG